MDSHLWEHWLRFLRKGENRAGKGSPSRERREEESEGGGGERLGGRPLEGHGACVDRGLCSPVQLLDPPRTAGPPSSAPKPLRLLQSTSRRVGICRRVPYSSFLVVFPGAVLTIEEITSMWSFLFSLPQSVAI